MQRLVRAYEGTVVAITGGTGYLASALDQALRKDGARVLLVSRKDIPPSPGAESLKADVRTADCWRTIVQRADVVFHLAGNTSAYAAAKDPAGSLLSTVAPLTHLAAAAREAGRRPRVLYASTATVYGLTPTLPVGEDTVLRPVTTYDLHKAFAEKQLELASTQGLVEGVSLRLANVYGPSSSGSSADDRGVLNRITKLALQGADLYLYGDGGYLRDYVYIDDVVRAFLVAGVQREIVGRSFNVASGVGCTVRDAFSLVAERAEKVTGRKSCVYNAPWSEDANPIEFRNFTARIDRMRSACGWKPVVTLADGVEHLIRHLGQTMNISR
jgi:nucleoside-diphosphate-sugar epimerase